MSISRDFDESSFRKALTRMDHPTSSAPCSVTQITCQPHAIRTDENDKPPDDLGRPNQAADMEQEK
ncbi:hypothetical protein O4160_02070 [Rhodococcus sp. IEGM 1401]|uniref:hypothetical protein n=1 Tax=unclassified Rhodococcus (in: high G+C Gram-positive bacteria) TaxID=192944 RepID=UPI0022B508FA|nr:MULTISPECIES: hypothetical protein [unclassified Rhodococcus (in: high G+C Gram-positive bacteria)]MCZ4559621.1 hypothetical protein [Rhodococcus sp. IEGM 1401]MDI9919426.1 hypothetical protein [Rhodococcus sp. IEGM 1372]MDV8032201.1 hypothetical protein [Rhodococcus sp. IEGM 1414]